MKRLKIKVIGDVQGVFYRFTAKQEADKLGLSGFAQNEPDNTVLVVVEGSSEALESFKMWLKQGPPMAEVENLNIEEEKYTGEYEGFEVK